MARDFRNWLRDLGHRVITEQDSERDKLNKTLAIFACGLMGFGTNLPPETLREPQVGAWNLKLETGSLQADALILATPAYVSGILLASLDPALASDLQNIP